MLPPHQNAIFVDVVTHRVQPCCWRQPIAIAQCRHLAVILFVGMFQYFRVGWGRKAPRLPLFSALQNKCKNKFISLGIRTAFCMRIYCCISPLAACCLAY